MSISAAIAYLRPCEAEGGQDRGRDSGARAWAELGSQAGDESEGRGFQDKNLLVFGLWQIIREAPSRLGVERGAVCRTALHFSLAFPSLDRGRHG